MLLREDRNKWINVAIKKSHLFTDTESDLKCFKYRGFLGNIWFFVCGKEQYFDTGAQISEMPGSDLLCRQLGISYFVPSTLSEWFLWRTAFRRRNYDAFSPGLRKLYWTSNKLKVWIIRQCCPLMDKACNIHNCPGGLGSVAASRFWLKQCKVITDWSLYWRTEWGGLLMLDFKLSVL